MNSNPQRPICKQSWPYLEFGSSAVHNPDLTGNFQVQKKYVCVCARVPKHHKKKGDTQWPGAHALHAGDLGTWIQSLHHKVTPNKFCAP